MTRISNEMNNVLIELDSSGRRGGGGGRVNTGEFRLKKNQKFNENVTFTQGSRTVSGSDEESEYFIGEIYKFVIPSFLLLISASALCQGGSILLRIR